MVEKSAYFVQGKSLFQLYGIDNDILPKLQPKNSVTFDDENQATKVDDKDINNFVSSLKIAPWGTDNLYPQQAVSDIRTNALAMRAMKCRIDIHYGNGHLLYKEALSENNSIRITPVLKNAEFDEFKKRNNLQKFQAGIISDWEWFRMAFYEIILSNDGKKINKIYHQPAMFCRFGLMDEDKNINKVYVSSRWGYFNSENDVAELPLLDFDNPLEDLRRCMKAGMKERKFIICDKINELDFVYYSFPYWDPIRSTWLKIAQQIPVLKDAMIKHQMVLKFHIKIPYSYWQNKYNDWNNPLVYTKELQEETIKKNIDEFNDFLTSSENYGKSIITHYGIDPMSLKNFEEWKIEPIDNSKFKDGAHISDSQAANSEIVTALGVDPALLGGQLPGGSEAGSGSNKREAFAIHQAQCGLDRAITTRWFNIVRDYNNWDEDLKIAYKDTDTSQTLNENPNGKQNIVNI